MWKFQRNNEEKGRLKRGKQRKEKGGFAQLQRSAFAFCRICFMVGWDLMNLREIYRNGLIIRESI